MTKLLSDEKILGIYSNCLDTPTGRLQAARAIESAVLEAQNKQEPVAWVYTVNNSHSVFSAEKPPEDAYDEGTLYPLFAAPVVQPDMVMVPREPTLAMLNCLRADTTPNLEKRYHAMIAAAEGKK